MVLSAPVVLGLLFRRLFAVSQIHNAGLALLFSTALRKLPAWFGLIRECVAGGPPLIRAVLDLPARCICEQFFDALDANLFRMDQLPDTPEPLDVVFGIESVSPLACGRDKAVLLVQPEGLGGRANEPRCNPHGIERRILVFQFIHVIRYHRPLIFSHALME